MGSAVLQSLRIETNVPANRAGPTDIGHFVAIDIFTGKKMEDLVPSSHTTSVPFVKKEEFQCIDADDDGFVTI
ncbi:MAG: hypothetical protein QGH07_10610, partial [Alphaproteobacteria bacterium]|nr:hypothetical protein [Alphaproteobacteria bacterium]